MTEQRQAPQVLLGRELALLESAQQQMLWGPDCWESLEREPTREASYSQEPTAADIRVTDRDLLKRASEGDLPCPWCGKPLRGELIHVELEDDDSYTGVRLSCSCGFVEY